MKYELAFYKAIIVILILAFIFVSIVLVFTTKDKNYANMIIDNGQQRISDLHQDIKDRDNVIINQLDYYYFLQQLLKSYHIEYPYYYEYQDLKVDISELLKDLKESGSSELKGMEEFID